MPAPDPRRFPPGKLVQLLNSFPSLGQVLTVSKLRRHREQAGFQISADGETVDLLKYTAWLCHRRHSKASPAAVSGAFGKFVEQERAEVAELLKGIDKP